MTYGGKRVLSLQASIIVVLSSVTAVFTVFLVLISRITIPSMLEQFENDFLVEQGHIIKHLFETAHDNTVAMNREIAVWDDMFQFTRGNNTGFLQKNWPDITPAKRYRINYFFIKDLDGNDLYISTHDHVTEKPLSLPTGFSGYLKGYCHEVLTQPRIDQDFETFGKSGILFFKDTPYFVSIMPIVASHNSIDTAGTLVFATLMSNGYFQDMFHFKNIYFELDRAMVHGITEPAIARHTNDRVSVLIPFTDFEGNGVVLSLETVRTPPVERQLQLNQTLLVLIFGFILFIVLLYFVAKHYLTMPLERMIRTIHRLTSHELLDEESYSANLEFKMLSSSINDMVGKITESSVSTSFFKKILNEMGTGLFVADINTGELLFLNDFLKELFHLDDRALEKSCWEVFHHNSQGRCATCPAGQLLKNPSQSVVYEELSDITGRYYKNTSSLIEWENNRQAILQNKVDITDIKMAEANLKIRYEQQELLTAVSNSFISSEGMNTLVNNAMMMLGIFMNVSRITLAKIRDGTLEFTYEWYNQKYAIPRLPEKRMFRFGKGEISYDSFVVRGQTSLVIADTEADPNIAALYRPLGIKSILSVPIFQYDEMWGILTVDECLSPRDWSASDIQLMRLVANSFSGLVIRSIAEEQLVTAKEMAEQSSRAKTMFLARMSHEMRTPMNAIVGMTTIAHSALNDAGKVESCLAKIGEASIHLKGVIDDILDMANIEAGKFRLSNEEFVLEEMIQNTAKKIDFKINEKGQSFVVDIGHEVPASIISDEFRLSQVLFNFISNANKFTPAGGSIKLSVQNIAEQAGVCTLRITVADNGIGISEVQQSRLFVLFEQLDGSTTRKFGGVGLGLAISRNIVELMGGKIGVASKLGNGSTFFIEIPVRRGKAKNAASTPVVNLEHLRILAVDDSKDILDFFIRFSARRGAYCEVASSGTAAYTLLEAALPPEIPFDIIFIDWAMPEIDGIELARKIKHLGNFTIILMSSAAEWRAIEKIEKTENEANVAGIDGYILKPLFSSPLVDCITRHLAISPPLASESGEDQSIEGIFTGKNILLAEDVEINQEIVIGLLEDTGVSIDCAGNGLEAVEKFKTNPAKYHLILMDIHMPELDGFDATRRIRQLEAAGTKPVPIMAMTANVFREDVDKCLECGMNDHIGKPVDFEELMRKLKKYLKSTEEVR